MDGQKTPVLKKIPSWLRSFRISKGDASIPQNKEARPASCQQKGFLRSYRRSLGSKKNKERGEESSHGSQDFARGSLMSIRKIWAEEAKAQTCGERTKSERQSKKSYALRTKLLGSPSKIPISEKMQTHQKELQLSFRNVSVSSNKENMAPVFAPKCKSYGNRSSAGSSDGNLASEIVLSAARHAKNRRSLVRECDVWKTAVNSMGFPRASTELEKLPKIVKEQDLPTLSPAVKVARNEKDKRVQDWVMRNDGCGSGLLARHTLPCVQQNQLPHRQFVEETIPKCIDSAPKIPPRTYLAKLAHAKAHLAKTVHPVACARAPTAAHNINGAKSALSGHGHSLCNKVEHDCMLSSKKAATKQRISSGRHRGMYVEVVHSRENPSKPQQLKKAVRPQVQHNPSYGTDCISRMQNIKKSCRAAGSDVMADDEATVLNCSCDRCLVKFSAAGKHVPGRTADLHNNCHRGMQRQTINSCFSKYGKHVSTVSHHCTCCQFKKTLARLKVADARGESSAYTEVSCEKISEKATKCSTSAKHAFHCQDKITKVIEEAVKASIEKLLSSNSIPQLSKSRSAESLHEPTHFKKASSSPLKYIPLSSCRSGTADALLSSTDGATVDSDIALAHQPSLNGGTVNEIIDDGEIFKTCSQSPHLEISLERSISLPSLVESSSPAKLKVSTAFIKLVKRVSSGHSNDKISSQHASFLDGAGNRGSLTSGELCSEWSSSGTEGCWQPAESHCSDDLCVHPEKTSHQMACSGANISKSQSREHGHVEPKISQSELQLSLELDESRSSLVSVSGRMPPDGWERTPPCDAPVRADLDDEDVSELNPRMSEDMQENCFSSDSDGSDDQHILEEVIRKGMGVTPPIKLPLRCPKLVKTPRKFKPTEMFCGKAKLKMSAYVNSGHVTVHVIRAAKLVTSRGGSASAYIKVSLHPDHIKRAHWRTVVVRSCRNPEFDHKFSFELMAEDTVKRLLVTVWHRDFENKRSELLGSMSFGMGKILNSDQYVKGWYRLLRQDLGMRRHFAARCSRGSCTKASTSHVDNIFTASENS